MTLITFLFIPEIHSAKAKKTVNADEVLQQGREAFYNYDFENAADLYDQYRTLKTKAKQPLEEDFEEWETQLMIATNAFGRVQKIVVIDSISIDAASFVRAYRLNPSAGKIGKIVDIASGGMDAANGIGFINEARDYAFFPVENSEGELRLKEGRQLLDGNWEVAESLQGDFTLAGDYAYPFMSGDGQTLYFANNGEDSMGGYDIFVAQRDPLTGEYLQPLNLGMPFNSPYNDFMMAVDEENGLGWWATDRARNDGKVTVYIYLIEDIRNNYPSDTEDLAALAMISDYKATWPEGKEKEYKWIISNLPKEKEPQKKDNSFDFDLGNGKIYTSLGDFRNPKAKDLMRQYLSKIETLRKEEGRLTEMRSRYTSDKRLSASIQKAEEEIEVHRSEVANLRSEILRLEKSVR